MSYKSNVKVMLETPEGYRAWLRLQAIREMVHHREIPLSLLSDASGKTHDYIAKALTGKAFFTYQDYDSVLDVVDDAISYVTMRRGYMCSCSSQAIAFLTKEMERHRE